MNRNYTLREYGDVYEMYECDSIVLIIEDDNLSIERVFSTIGDDHPCWQFLTDISYASLAKALDADSDDALVERLQNMLLEHSERNPFALIEIDSFLSSHKISFNKHSHAEYVNPDGDDSYNIIWD